MRINQFKIGKPFWMRGKQYRCTDIGSRAVAAICIHPIVITTTSMDYKTKKIKKKSTTLTDKDKIKSWQSGPPYALAEIVINEQDMEVCTLTKASR